MTRLFRVLMTTLLFIIACNTCHGQVAMVLPSSVGGYHVGRSDLGSHSRVRLHRVVHHSSRGSVMKRHLYAAACVGVLCAGAQAYTAAERTACAPDAFRLCTSAIPQGIPAIVKCMAANQSQVSAACKAAIAAAHGGAKVTQETVSRDRRPSPRPAVTVSVTTDRPLPSVNPATISSPIDASPKRWETSMFEFLGAHAGQGFALFGILVLAYWVATKLLAPGATWLTSLVTVAKSDFAALEARVSSVETAVGIAPAVVTPATAKAKSTAAAVTPAAVAPAVVAPASPAASA
jgi:hypothetical protein